MKIGYVLSKGFSNADVIGSQAVLGLTGVRFAYISKNIELLEGQVYPIRTTATFDNCGDIDIMIIPSLNEKNDDFQETLNFIRKRVSKSKIVVGLSDGVLALAKAGALKNIHVTSNAKVIDTVSDYGAIGVHSDTFVKDKKYITAGPSTATVEAAYYLVSLIRGKAVTKMLELNLEYNPREKFRNIENRSFEKVEKDNLHVGVICPPNLYLPDVAGAIEVFSKLPNARIHLIWKDKGEKTSILGPTIASTMTFDECPQMDVLITGAIMPKDTVDQELLNFYRKQSVNARAVVGVCAGVFAVGASGLLQDRRSVTNLHMMRMLKNVDAIRYIGETTQDGKYYTAGPAIGSYEIALDVIANIYGIGAAAYIEQDLLEYHPHPLFDKGTREKAGFLRSYLSLLISSPFLLLYRSRIKKAYRNSANLS